MVLSRGIRWEGDTGGVCVCSMHMTGNVASLIHMICRRYISIYYYDGEVRFYPKCLDTSFPGFPPTGMRSLGLVTLDVVVAAREANRHWVEDCLVLLLCVLALDRFGDYGSDQVTAPVSMRGRCAHNCVRECTEHSVNLLDNTSGLLFAETPVLCRHRVHRSARLRLRHWAWRWDPSAPLQCGAC